MQFLTAAFMMTILDLVLVQMQWLEGKFIDVWMVFTLFS
jgi:hypothetical protein